MSLVWHAAPRLIATVRQPRYAIAQEGRWRFPCACRPLCWLSRFGPADHPCRDCRRFGPRHLHNAIPTHRFSAVVDVERSSVGRTARSRTLNSSRDRPDGSGRIHNESRDLVPVSYTKTPRIVRIHIYDPQTRVSTYLDPNERTFWTETSATRLQRSTHGPLGAQTGDNLPRASLRKKKTWALIRWKDCPVHGVRETQMIPAENGVPKGRSRLRMSTGIPRISASPYGSTQ